MWLPFTDLIVPDDGDVRGRAAVVGDVVLFGAWDPTGGKEERVELHAQGPPSHLLHGQMAADTQQNTVSQLVLSITYKVFGLSDLCSA